jgi:ABC-type nitrate/sulfonate/bicarbonate transport system substrate-binding protein
MARSDAGYKSVGEFVQSGLSADAAIQAAMKQMTGKTFAYPAEASVKPFIDLAIHKGGLARSAFKSLVLDDPLTVNAMRNKQADFQVGGVPSRLTLQREGFKPIVSAADLAKIAKPSPESDELASIFTDGWACSREYYQHNPDTVLRLSSVNFRITKFMNEHMDEALAIHMPYLSQVTGQTFSAAEGAIFYKSLDPFYTFEAQQSWYHDPASVDFYMNMNGAIINNFIKQGIYKQKPPTVDDVSVAADVYQTLETLRDSETQKLSQLAASNGGDNLKSCIARARRYFDAYDFLDADKTAQACMQAK